MIKDFGIDFNMQPEAPIIISESGDIDLFETVEDAENKLEAEDVLDGLFVGFDCKGRRLTLTVEKKTSKWFFGVFDCEINRVKISCQDQGIFYESELKQLLINYFRDTGEPYVGDPKLQTLIEKFICQYGFTL